MSGPTFTSAPKLENSPQQLGAEKIVTNFLSKQNQQPYQTTWWLLQMRSKSFRFMKHQTAFLPQQQLTPLQAFWLQPSMAGLGSDHRISEMILLSSISTGLRMVLRIDRSLIWGESPPCTQNILYPTTAATGMQLKVSVMTFQALRVNLRLHQSKKPYNLLSQVDQWLPLRRKKVRGCFILQDRRSRMHSRDCLPLSTQSPRKRQFFWSGCPKSLKMLSRSQYCPWVSPQIWTGASSSRSMGCSSMIFLAREQMPSTSPSRIAQALSWLAGVYFSLMIMSSILSTLLFFLLPYIPLFFYQFMGRIFQIEEKEIYEVNCRELLQELEQFLI